MYAFITDRSGEYAHYDAAKAAIAHLTKSLAVAWAKYNIRVNSIAPGYIWTPMTERARGTKMADEWADLTPMGRVGEPYELKGLALFLASKASSFVTGSVILVDGGYTCW